MPTSILIIRLSSFGDILLTFPLIHLLKKNFPNIKIDFLVDKNFKDVFEPIKNYNLNLILFDKSKGIGEVVKHRKLIKQNQYSWIVDLQNNYRSFLLSIGLSKELFKFKKNRIRRFIFVKYKLKVFSKKLVSEKYIDSLREKLKIQNNGKIKVKVSENILLNLKNKFPFLTEEDKKVIIYPGAKHFTKKWPLEYYDALIEKISETGKWIIIISGDKNDAMETEKLKSLSLDNVYDISGKPSIAESIYLTFLADFVISNDSAPMHVAALFEKPQISIWGNTV
ncbi:MAG: glycosyltransferase family 9 protein, partial [Calditrichia bacterium]|nr:glycosyltransferase family 9 protein [Calditrichia bacterium]